MAKAREKSKRKIADKETLEKRAKNQAKKALEKKLSGGKSKSELSLSQRAQLEKRIKKKAKVIERGAKKLRKKVKADDRAATKAARSGSTDDRKIQGKKLKKDMERAKLKKESVNEAAPATNTSGLAPASPPQGALVGGINNKLPAGTTLQELLQMIRNMMTKGRVR